MDPESKNQNWRNQNNNKGNFKNNNNKNQGNGSQQPNNNNNNGNKKPYYNKNNNSNGQYNNNNSGYQNNQNNDVVLQRVSSLLGCQKNDLSVFDEADPFNPLNTVNGVICRKEGKYFGTRVILQVNRKELKEPEIIFSTPNMQPYGCTTQSRNVRNSIEKLDTKEVVNYFAANKWNGLNIQFFKYHDSEGKSFVTVGTRGNSFFSAKREKMELSALKEIVFQISEIYTNNTNNNNNNNNIMDEPDFSKMTEDEQFDYAMKKSLEGENTNNNSNSNCVVFEDLTTSEGVWINLNKKDRSLFPPLLQPLESPKIQSLVFELCGSEYPEYVAYQFPRFLVPIFQITTLGTFIPQNNDALYAQLHYKYHVPNDKLACEDQEKHRCFWESVVELSIDKSGTNDISPNTNFLGLPEFARDSIANTYQIKAHEVNKKYRELFSQQARQYFNSFIVEGKVIYLLDKNGEAEWNKLFKAKPLDFDMFSHNNKFDGALQYEAISALAKVYKRELEGTESMIKKEMDMRESNWQQFGSEIMFFVKGIPNIHSPKYERSAQKMVILCGLPASGKSTFANKLIELNPHWSRVNQDEMGTRKVCEQNAKNAFLKKHSVVVDRCNFDYSQRNVWVKLASGMQCNDVICVALNFSTDVCKSRIQTRENHPTIKSGDDGVAIIDKFSSFFVQPCLWEGFSDIVKVSSVEEFDVVISKLAKINLK